MFYIILYHDGWVKSIAGWNIREKAYDALDGRDAHRTIGFDRAATCLGWHGRARLQMWFPTDEKRAFEKDLKGALRLCYRTKFMLEEWSGSCSSSGKRPRQVS